MTSSTHHHEKIQKLIDKQINLPSPPAIVVQILNTVQKENASLQDLTQIISADPALTAKMLRVANSSLYALPNKVSSIERALCVLGTNVIKNIALSFVVAKDIRGKGTVNFSLDYFWRRSVTAAVAAELLTNRLQEKNDDIFVTALLQDIGILIMYQNKGEEYIQLLENRLIFNSSLCELEQKTFGFDHQQLGSTLLTSWGLPDTIAEPLRFHHDTIDAPEKYAHTAKILRISNQLSSIYSEPNCAQKVRSLQEQMQLLFGFDIEQVRELVDDVAIKSIEFLEVFELDPGEIKPYSQMLQEANDELGRLNLSYEQLVLELKESKENAENLAHELQQAMTRLKQLVFRDSLTGLFNHRYFQESLNKELSRALRYQSSVGLITFDIDSFKNINDKYGHPIGDLVLMNVARVVEGAVRPSDVIARYGGEEFAVILPHTNKAGMSVFAERLRRSVEGSATSIEGIEIFVTISVGGVCWTPDSPQVTKKTLVETADRGLYMSKRNGRNLVTILEPQIADDR
jgi:diguanylate cyclase (GGDEF)-like protein